MKSLSVGLIALVFVFATSAYAKSGVVTVYNDGSFYANLTVSYMLNNMNITTASDPFSNGENGALLVPDGALDTYVKVQALVSGGSYKTIYERSFPGEFSQYTWNNTGHLCLNVTGTINYPTCFENTCPSNGMEVDFAVTNGASFVANFSLQYSLYNMNKTQLSESFPSGKSQHMKVPAGAADATVKIQAQLPSGQYKTACEKYFPGLLENYSEQHDGRVCMTMLGSIEHAVCYAYKC